MSLVQFVNIEDPYAEQHDTIVDDDDAEETPQLLTNSEDLWAAEEQTSFVVEEETYAANIEPEHSPEPVDNHVTSRLATLHLIKHYKEGPGTW
jgi:hypothetical protein